MKGPLWEMRARDGGGEAGKVQFLDTLDVS